MCGRHWGAILSTLPPQRSFPPIAHVSPPLWAPLYQLSQLELRGGRPKEKKEVMSGGCLSKMAMWSLS